MSLDVISIDMAEMAIGTDRTRILTMSLGSCVAVVIQDRKGRVGGMAHCMLPSRKKSSDGADLDAVKSSKNEMVAKYVDESISRLVDEVIKIGGKKENLKAKIVGGAKMFRFLNGDDHGIGFRNAESAKDQLKLLGIPLESEDTGGTAGRSVDFNIETGLVQITTVI